ncbi:MAG: 1,2-phenylacetyl-CoA epoxidase subunit PaaD [Chitinophagales bacterium]|nr:phenylacetate-CoA oxygenase subunit PaaJ [Chitinophagales bacterium]MDW8393258.1 1,2-phenylacetyl-CoA epoxidase subunit PaaD [Chitinophagales bacterium]
MVTEHIKQRTPVLSLQAVWDALAQVHDPELPDLSIVDLGMVSEIKVNDNRVQVKIIPTYTACPATALIQLNVAEQLRGLGFAEVEVLRDSQTPWSSNRISESGRKKLQALGLAPPPQFDSPWTEQTLGQATCPFCGSNDTHLHSLFGTTLCRSTHFCTGCGQLFERFKPL